MGPDPPLPLPPDFSNTDDYVESLLKFTTSSWLLQTLCGGVHILDFYTRTPDLYSTILPQEWREWFKERHIMDILDLLMREDLRQFDQCSERDGTSIWRGGPAPPRGLVRYLKDVRKHLLGRTFPPSNSRLPSQKSSIARHIAVGMKVKKVHEVDNFARYVDRLTSDIAAARKKEITHLVDFGSGQNYLGRALAAPPYSKHIIAVESKQHNIEGAKNMDMLAKLVPKPLIMRNKKEFRAGLKNKKQKGAADCESSECEPSNCDSGECNPPFISEPKSSTDCNSNGSKQLISDRPVLEIAMDYPEPCSTVKEPEIEKCETGNSQTLLSISQDQEEEKSKTETMTLQIYTEGHGSVQYVEHRIKDGDLSPVISQILDSSQIQPSNSTHTSNVVSEPTNLTSVPKSIEPNIMVISLHSCGNLVHHGLRSLLLNRSISAVAMVGCCYNLVTERLGPPTYKLPSLRPNHPRLEATSNTFDPHGFPMSEQLATYPLPHTPLAAPNTNINGNASSPQIPQQTGIRLNITARMMAVQAPQNWGPTDSDLFFTRHFYRALLQRIFLERGVVSAPVDHEGIVGGAVSAAGHTSKVLFTPPNGRGPGLSSNGTTTPLTIGTLRKFAYKDFFSYVRAAISKLTTPNTFCEVDPEFIAEKMDGLTDEEILDYEAQYAERKKELSVMWSLMAFSAGVVEAVIVVDRWLWLKEQKEVGECWVEPVFEYGMSPRNLVVVGVKNDSS